MTDRSIVVLFAHPYPDRSRAGSALLRAVSDLPSVSVRSLYERYPDFSIDVASEREALRSADVLVWQCPFYWYGLPSLLHLWIEKVLANGWAYGPGGRAVAGKRALWVTTTGAPLEAYEPGAMHGHRFEAFVPAVEQTARFCGMEWEPPIVLHGAHRISDAVLADKAQQYRARLIALAAPEGSG
jgi:glutathione-regulated potassium-efflux system ancillary protein KefF